MSARILEGRPIARALEAELVPRVEALKAAGVAPCLAVVVVGGTEPALAYQRTLAKACGRVGVLCREVVLPAETGAAFACLEELNRDPAVHGVIIKRPLPASLGDEALLQALDPAKDVDGCHFTNLGRLLVWGPQVDFPPCTPAGVLEILKRSGLSLRGRHAVVLGRSVTVGKPLAALLLHKDPWADATVTVCHSGTADLAGHIRQADLVVAAIGVPRFVTADMVRPGAIVVDVGTNSVPDPERPHGFRLVGDVDFAGVREVAGAITPVPGGVGPVTTALALRNLLRVRPTNRK